MADLSITLANVEVGVGSTIALIQCGEAVGQIEPLYRSSTDNLYYQSQADGTEEEAEVAYISLTGCSAADEYVVAISAGTLVIGATVVAGTEYCVSATKGKICPWVDIAATEYVSPIGYGISTTEVTLGINPTGIVKPT